LSLDPGLAQYSQSDRLIWLGHQSDDALQRLYRNARLFLFPSLYEGFGLPPLEAMASGTPTIASNSSSLPEVVQDGAIQVNPLSVEDITQAILRGLTDHASVSN